MSTPEKAYLLVSSEGDYEEYMEEVIAVSFRREEFDERVKAHMATQAKKRKANRTYLDVREAPFTP